MTKPTPSWPVGSSREPEIKRDPERGSWGEKSPSKLWYLSLIWFQSNTERRRPAAKALRIKLGGGGARCL